MVPWLVARQGIDLDRAKVGVHQRGEVASQPRRSAELEPVGHLVQGCILLIAVTFDTGVRRLQVRSGR